MSAEQATPSTEAATSASERYVQPTAASTEHTADTLHTLKIHYEKVKSWEDLKVSIVGLVGVNVAFFLFHWLLKFPLLTVLCCSGIVLLAAGRIYSFTRGVPTRTSTEFVKKNGYLQQIFINNYFPVSMARELFYWRNTQKSTLSLVALTVIGFIAMFIPTAILVHLASNATLLYQPAEKLYLMYGHPIMHPYISVITERANDIISKLPVTQEVSNKKRI